MVFGIFKRKNEQVETLEVNRKSDIYETVVKGLDRIEREGVDRVIMCVAKIEPQDTISRFINANETNYYPFELLLEYEQRMMLDEKYYQVIALVTKNVMGQIENPGKGIEVYDRIHFHPFLSALKNTSNLKYISKGGVYTEGNGLSELCQALDWTPEMFEKGLEQGINLYKHQTIILLENHKELQERLRQIQERDCSLIEQMLNEVGSNLK